MRFKKLKSLSLGLIILLLLGSELASQSKGLKAISTADMKYHLAFLAAKEFRGRSAPSVELDLAAHYLAHEARRLGLKPLMPDGSFYQHVPVEVTYLSPFKSSLRVLFNGGMTLFSYPQSFTCTTRSGGDWAQAGGLVMAGTALNSTPVDEKSWEGIDLRGKFVISLESPRPAAARGPSQSGQAGATASRILFLRNRGAAGLITVVSPEREKNLREKNLFFDQVERYRWLDVDMANPAPPPVKSDQASAVQPTGQTTPPNPFYTLEVRQEVGASLLGITIDELNQLFSSQEKGIFIPPRILSSPSIEVTIAFEKRLTSTPNVVAYLPGRDPVLKNEYVVISSHHDHVSVREGRVFPGADDNASGCVAMLALAKAFLVERPKRSVIFVWNTAEERGLIGSYYFVQHCPLPVEKISANLNLDMLTRNDPNSVYLIGSNKLSSELDKSIQEMNARSVRLQLDYRYEDPGEPNRFFFRSDHYPYIRYGIPAVWFFCGTTPDYHTENDVEEKCDYHKMEKITKLVYLTAMDIGNKPALLKLDLHPEVKTRGKHNMQVIWQRPPQPRDKS